MTYIEPKSAAERIGIRVDDVIMAVEGTTGRGYDHTLQLLTCGGTQPPKRPLTLTLLRPQQIINSPLHFSLGDEIKKASRILDAISSAPETDAMLELMRDAVGFIFMTTAKIGGPVSACGGTGILIARLPNGDWSAPVAVGSFGMSWGLQVGAAVADVMIVFMKPSALWPFMSDIGTDIHLGPESGIAVGPIGRTAGVSGGVHTNTEKIMHHLEKSTAGTSFRPSSMSGNDDPLENPFTQLVQPEQLQERAFKAKEKLSDGLDDVKELVVDMSRMPQDQLQAELKAEATRHAEAAAEKLRNLRPAYTYSHCKGLFVGISLEGTAMSVRHDINAQFYGKHSWTVADVAMALEGGIERPDEGRQSEATFPARNFYARLRDLTGCRAPAILKEQTIRPPAPQISVSTSQGEQRSAIGNSGSIRSSWQPPRNTWDHEQAEEPYNPFREVVSPHAAHQISRKKSLSSQQPKQQRERQRHSPQNQQSAKIPDCGDGGAFSIEDDEDGDQTLVV